jgi:hypothetical protein
MVSTLDAAAAAAAAVACAAFPFKVVDASLLLLH